MNILLITHYYPPEIGAPQRRWSALVKRWQAAGHRVTVCCPPPHYPDASATVSIRKNFRGTPRVHQGKYGERIIRVPYVLHGVSGLARTLDQVVAALGTMGVVAALRLQKSPFDVVVATVPGIPTAGAGLVAKKLLGTPLVLEMRDAWPDIVADPQTPVGGLAPLTRARRVFARAVTWAQGKADALVTTTESFARVLRVRGMNNVHTVSNGVAPSLFYSAIDPLPDRPGELRLLYTGTLGRSQGLKVLLDALELAVKERPDISFTLRLVGEGAERQQLSESVQARGLPVEFLPLQHRSQVRKHYEWSDVTHVSLRRTPVFAWTVPSKLYELLTVPRLVVGLLEGEAEQILRESAAGIRLTPESAQELADLWFELADDRSRLQPNDNGRQFVLEHFNYDHLAHKYLTVLEAVISRERSG
ncbi:MAG: glycosyltransferase family 4 protein [Rothia sp. (in: high G+C Gram-positive bacteria)]|uniref:glycosyltransferase family 4 protein n=1 Tax=Rothia sp. (in: high G+C Gram-positive bacteria) TaxID=1885016 RepID=UPI002703AE02|nr:glycosyltransferase family 4 protein [Rothia sp. (in: high G+C Gram-positive bacteria)]